MDDVIVKFPSREWAVCAMADLEAEGCRAQLLERCDGQGLWQVRVTGPAGKIAELREAAEGRRPRVDWEAFVNLTLAGR